MFVVTGSKNDLNTWRIVKKKIEASSRCGGKEDRVPVREIVAVFSDYIDAKRWVYQEMKDLCDYSDRLDSWTEKDEFVEKMKKFKEKMEKFKVNF